MGGYREIWFGVRRRAAAHEAKKVLTPSGIQVRPAKRASMPGREI